MCGKVKKSGGWTAQPEVSVVSELAGADDGGLVGMGGVGSGLLGPVAVGVVLIGVLDDGRLGERRLGRLLCGRLIGDHGAVLADGELDACGDNGVFGVGFALFGFVAVFVVGDGSGLVERHVSLASCDQAILRVIGIGCSGGGSAGHHASHDHAHVFDVFRGHLILLLGGHVFDQCRGEIFKRRLLLDELSIRAVSAKDAADDLPLGVPNLRFDGLVVLVEERDDGAAFGDAGARLHGIPIRAAERDVSSIFEGSRRKALDRGLASLGIVMEIEPAALAKIIGDAEKAA